MSSPANGLVGSVQNMVNNSLPVRIAQLYQRIGTPLKNGYDEVRQMMGLPPSESAPTQDTSWHDDMVRKAFGSFGMRTPPAEKPNLMQMWKPLGDK